MTLEKIRKDAEDRFENLELPDSIRTPGRTWTLYPVMKDLEVSQSVEPDLSVEGEAEVFTGDEALEEAAGSFMDAVKRGENRLTMLHFANVNSLVFVRAKGKAEVDVVYDEDSPVFAHLVVEADMNAEVDVTESFRGSSEVQTSFNEFYLGSNSTLNYGVIESMDAELSYSRRKALVGRDAEMNWLNCVFDSDLNRTKIETVLKGDNSETENIGIWYPVEDQHFDIAMHVYHRGENTRCDMDSRAVVDDRARSVYEGLQQVEEEAENTSSFQDEEVLLLSDEAEDDASPKLMIENPEVEASHAASTGGLPEKELHYLKSRGLSEEEARKLIVKGYFEPVMQKIQLPELKKTVREEVEKKLSR